MSADEIQRSVNEVATTEDTGDPVFKVSVGDASAHVICADGHLYVPSVHATGDTPMAAVIDHAVATFGLTRVKFTNVISPRLEAKLDGFDVEYEEHAAIGEQVKVLVGEWDSRGDER